jgi:hypothetical protein
MCVFTVSFSQEIHPFPPIHGVGWLEYPVINKKGVVTQLTLSQAAVCINCNQFMALKTLFLEKALKENKAKLFFLNTDNTKKKYSIKKEYLIEKYSVDKGVLNLFLKNSVSHINPIKSIGFDNLSSGDYASVYKDQENYRIFSLKNFNIYIHDEQKTLRHLEELVNKWDINEITQDENGRVIIQRQKEYWEALHTFNRKKNELNTKNNSHKKNIFLSHEWNENSLASSFLPSFGEGDPLFRLSNGSKKKKLELCGFYQKKEYIKNQKDEDDFKKNLFFSKEINTEFCCKYTFLGI